MQVRKVYRIVLIGVMSLLSALFYLNYGRSALTFYGDDLGYYLYLPSAFIYDNLDSMDVLPADRGIQEVVHWYTGNMRSGGSLTSEGKVVDQYTYGVALMESPFFLAAHAFERITGRPVNGFSSTYIAALKAASLCYGCLGLLLVYRILRRSCTRELSLTVVAALLLGTNLFWFMLHQAGMAHTPVFFLVAALMWLTIRFYERPGRFRALLIGCTLGLITVIRPTDIVTALIPLLYGVCDRGLLKERWHFLRSRRDLVLWACLAFLLPILPQLIYWKWMTGHFLYYSYAGQSFNWTYPRILDGLFGGNNGWLAYSPVMLMCLPGLLLFRRYRNWAWVMLLILPVYIYVIYSWWCFNYINGLGSRPMIHLYPLLALPFAAALTWTARRGRGVTRIAATMFLLAGVVLNLNFSIQQSLGILGSETSNYIYNATILFRNRLRYNDLVVRDTQTPQPDSRHLRRVAILGGQDFEQLVHAGIEGGGPGGRYYHIRQEEDLPFPLEVRYDARLFGGSRWLRCRGRFNVAEAPDWQKHWLRMRFYRGDRMYDERSCSIVQKIGLEGDSCGHLAAGPRLDHFELRTWGFVSFFVRIPREIRTGDRMVMDVRNVGGKDAMIDDLSLELYE